MAGELTDPVITPQLRAGLAAITVLRNYIADAESHDCAMLLAWPNPAYQEG